MLVRVKPSGLNRADLLQRAGHYGVSELMSGWFERIRAVMPQWSINSRCRKIPLVAAHYGADAGIAGAAALCVSPSDPVIR